MQYSKLLAFVLAICSWSLRFAYSLCCYCPHHLFPLWYVCICDLGWNGTLNKNVNDRFSLTSAITDGTNVSISVHTWSKCGKVPCLGAQAGVRNPQRNDCRTTKWWPVQRANPFVYPAGPCLKEHACIGLGGGGGREREKAGWLGDGWGINICFSEIETCGYVNGSIDIAWHCMHDNHSMPHEGLLRDIFGHDTPRTALTHPYIRLKC